MTQSPIETLQPEQSGGWIEHDGSVMPVRADTIVQVRWCGSSHEDHRAVPAGYFFRYWHGDDIAFYRIHKPAAPSSEPQP